MKQLKLIAMLIALPVIFGSCAKSFSDRSALKKSMDEATRVTGDSLYSYMQDPSHYYVVGQSYTEDYIQGTSTTLFAYLRAHNNISINTIWNATACASAKAVYIGFVVSKADKKQASLHIGLATSINDGKGGFVTFKGTLDKELTDGATVTFTGADSKGFATFSGTFAGGNLTTTKILLDQDQKQFSVNLKLDNVF